MGTYLTKSETRTRGHTVKEAEYKRVKERSVGDKFIEWYNKENGTNFTFSSAPDPPAADLLYMDGSIKLPIEVTIAAYDQRLQKHTSCMA